MNMDIDTKLTVLKEIYKIYGHFSSSLHVSCSRGCATCCTRNVTLTTLEGRHILEYVSAAPEKQYLEILIRDQKINRFRPEITLNGIARCFKEGKETPSENYPGGGKCPLLDNDLCSIYPARPFGCRCFLSKTDCGITGTADVDPFVVTVNHVFLQVIEHIDTDGFTGNLTDMLVFLDSNSSVNRDGEKYHPMPSKTFVPNCPIPMLLIPPEHKKRIAGILSQLDTIRVPRG